MKDLAALQDTNSRLAAIKREVAAHTTTTQHGYLLGDNVIYCKEDKGRTRWKAMLPTCPEAKYSDSCTTLGDIWVSIIVSRKLDRCCTSEILGKALEIYSQL
jgi:hypothetical protein